jgi:hypothetical protein
LTGEYLILGCSTGNRGKGQIQVFIRSESANKAKFTAIKTITGTSQYQKIGQSFTIKEYSRNHIAVIYSHMRQPGVNDTYQGVESHMSKTEIFGFEYDANIGYNETESGILVEYRIEEEIDM